MASVKGTFSYEVEHLFVGMRVILDGGTHADDDSPRGVGSEDEHGVVDSSELRVDDSLHLMPLIHLKSVVSDRSRQVSSGVTMKTVTIGQLRFIVLTIWLNKGTDVANRFIELFLDSVH